jgi:hypothetical protein
MIGFVTLAGLALAILAGLVLLPAYAQWSEVVHERDCQKVAVAEHEATVEAQRRLLEALPDNDVLTKRLALSQGELMPGKEVVVQKPGATRSQPDVIQPIHYQRPPRPDNWLLTLAGKVQKPATRRGLLLLAAGTLLTAMFLFAPPDRRGRKDRS